MVLFTLCDCDCDCDWDARGTFEPTVKDWEKRLRIPVPEEQDESSPKPDSTSIDYEKLYIDAQRINNGHE